MTNPCELGMKCPYRGFDDDGDGVCFYPYIVGRDTVAPDEVYPLDYEANCPLVDCDTVFCNLIDAYGDAEPKILDGIATYRMKCDRVYQEIVAKRKERDDCRALYIKAYKIDPRATDELTEIFHSTDMPQSEYISHLKIIIEGDIDGKR